MTKRTDQSLTLHYKDEVLNSLAESANVAQFISYDAALQQRFSRVFGTAPNAVFQTIEEAAAILLRNSAEGSVNVRSFEPSNPKSREFVYGLKSVDSICAAVRRLAANGLYTILNETIDVHDGGVSGVMLGDVIEFAPEDTPRCVEKPGTASFPRELGLRLLKIVYGFGPDLRFDPNVRVEFSVHPLRRGVRNSHTIVWEREDISVADAVADIRWPNRFSEFIGDKAFGLLIAHLHGLLVPRVSVIGRSVPPFEFGSKTTPGETWIRTCPRVQTPGKFTTRRGWVDPFKLMHLEDPSGGYIASVLAQDGVDAQYSGAVLSNQLRGSKSLIIEGTRGFGDRFMVGEAEVVKLPTNVKAAVRRAYAKAAKALGPVRMEWVYDGSRVWIVQFHRGASPSIGSMIFPGATSTLRHFPVSQGLEALRKLVSEIQGGDVGVVLVGDVGVTSHFGDLLRKAQIPSRIERIRSDV